MKKTLTAIISTFLLCPFFGQAQNNAVLPLKTEGEWKIFIDVESPASYDKIPESLKSPEGKTVKPKTVKSKDANIDISALNGSLMQGATALLFTEFNMDKAATVSTGASADWWMEIYVNGKSVYSTMNTGNGSGSFKPEDHVFTFPVKAGKNIIAAKVKAGSAGWRFVMGNPPPTKPNIKFEANNDWKVVDMKETDVKAGSALDQSDLAKLPPPSGIASWLGLSSNTREKLSRLKVNENGKLIAEDIPDVRLRLRGTNINYPWVAGDATKDPDWKKTWEDFAKAAKYQGYNVIRTGFALGYPDAPFKPEAVDKADYMLATFGKNGLYLYMVSSVYMKAEWAGGTERRDHPLRMFLGDKEVRDSWKKGAFFFMNHVNPYNGLAWKDDPAIGFVELFNEQEWGYMHSKAKLHDDTKKEADAKYREWLKAKYKTVEKLAEAWKEKDIDSFEKAEIPPSFPVGSKKIRDNDYLLFLIDLSHESAEWMYKTMRETGYKGIITQYNISHWLGGQEARYEVSQATIANTYHNHPSSFSRAGSKCGQNSAVGGAGGYWRGIASMRFADRPFVETEFNHSFWNPYVYECGPLFGAYSALQGFDCLIIHEGAVYFRKKDPVDVFSVGRNPINRAGEFLSACLFQRGDIKESSHRIELQIPKDYLESNCNAGKTVSTEQNKIALMSGFTISFPWAKRPDGIGNAKPADLVMPPADGAEFKSAGGGWAVDAIDSKNSKFSLDAAVKTMKDKGILPESNISEPSKGIFQSDTGEITMRTKENLLKILTARSEAVTLENDKGESVGQLEVIKTSTRALVSVSSVDKDKALKDSKRIVLVYATEVANTGLELSYDRVTLVNLGTQPVLMKTGKLEVNLKNSNAEKLSLYALGFDGSRREKLPVKAESGVLKISIDTSLLKDGPTSFFELVAE